MKTINIVTGNRNEFVDITAEVENIIKVGKVNNGLCLVFCPHTTAGLTINENADPAVKHDIMDYLEKLVPRDKGFSHSEGNSDAHIKSSLLGNSLQIIVENGKLLLGTWQGIYFCEFDGPRRRNVYVEIL